MSVPIVPGDLAYYRFWTRVALAAAAFAVIVVVDLTVIAWGVWR